jgi:hypothetical protein
MNNLSSGRLDSIGAGAPEITCPHCHRSWEIEVTPEMKETGDLCFSEFDSRIEDRGDILTRVFRAMLSVMRRAK